MIIDRLVTYFALALTISLSVTRPRILNGHRLDPAIAATCSVVLLLLAGVVRPADVISTALELWRPMVTIVSIMVSAAVAHRLGVLRQLGAMLFADPSAPAGRVFLRVFVLTAVTSTVLNNDAAVLLLTPLVLSLVKERFPGEDRLATAFAFAVFTAVGVAPFVISNPMNMIVAAYANLDFNHYAAWMLPITVIGWLIAFPILRRLFARDLNRAPAAAAMVNTGKIDVTQKIMLGLLVGAIGAYPLIAIVDSSLIWVVAAIGAIAALLLAWSRAGHNPVTLLRQGVAWNVLIFLGAVFVLAIGLRNVGVVDALARVYADGNVLRIGTTAALGSAVLNNHPMAIINMMALETTSTSGLRQILAALIGGDLGPRLLPIGSLAGLLWMEACRREGVEIRVVQFIKVGVAVTVPTLLASLLILQLR